MRKAPKFVVRSNGLFSLGILQCPSNLEGDDFINLDNYAIVGNTYKLNLDLVGSIPLDARIFEERLNLEGGMEDNDLFVRAGLVSEIYSDLLEEVCALAKKGNESYYGLDVKVTKNPQVKGFAQNYETCFISSIISFYCWNYHLVFFFQKRI